MFKVVGIMVLGILIGYAARNISILQKVGSSISLTIFLLLFLLGVSVGSNEAIVKELGRLGQTALLIAVAGTVGSVIAAWLINRYFSDRGNK